MINANRASGLVLVGLGALTIYGASLLPPMLGQDIGPSVFPTIIGSGLCLCGILIALGVGSSFEEEEAIILDADGNAAPVPPPTTWQYQFRALLPIGALLFYLLVVERIGFVPAAFVVVASVALSLGARLTHAIALAAIAPVVIHLIFAKFLRVPLPAGLLPMPW